MANIFHFATKELSQDAFLCWIFRHADDEIESSTRTISRKLLDLMVHSYRKLNSDELVVEPWDNYILTIEQQVEDIDILLTFTSKITEKKFQILIEDKTWSEESRYHQIEHYLAKLKVKNSEMEVIPVFLKTGYVSSKKLSELNNRNIVTVTYLDIYDILKGHIDSNNLILSSWWEHFMESFYTPIQEATNVPLQNVMESLAQWAANRLAKEILFDRITDYIFGNSTLGFLSQRIVESKKANMIYEHILYQPEWRKPDREFEIGIYFSWSKEFSLDIKTIPFPYLTKEKMPADRLLEYENAQNKVKQRLVLPEDWTLSKTYLQIAKLKNKGITSWSLEDLKSKVMSDLSFLVEKINLSIS